jgi:EDD domain protein, DegV family
MIAIVVDSTAYITRKEAEIYGVSVVPSVCSVGDFKLRDRYINELDRADEEYIYKNTFFAVTSQPEVKSFYNIFRELVTRGYDVLCITISSKMSTTYNTACIAANHLTGANICVVDSRVSVGGMFLLIKKARNMANNGMSLGEIANELLRIRDNIEIRYTVDDLAVMKNSKRLSYIKQSAASVLNLKPIFTCSKGSILLETTARNGYDAIRRLTAKITPQVDNIIIHYIKPIPLIEDMRKYLAARYPNALIQVRKLGPVIGINTGQSMMAIVWYAN